MTQKNCPAAEELKSFVRCEISEQQASQIEQHLESCKKCEDTVVGMERDSDTVAERIRKATAQKTFADEPECQKLVKVMQDGRAFEATQLSAADSSGTGSSIEIPEGEVLRDYKVVTKLGEGGMGAVYKAVHQRLKKHVALKVMPTKTIGDLNAVARFEREMEVLGQLNHPNIVQALDAGEHEGQHYLVMEYVAGSDLSDITRRCSPLSVADACLMISQAAAGLQYAHENGFVHRDIKPSNLMLARSGSAAGRSSAAVKILDLGLARAFEQRPNMAGSAELTSAGQVMGTLDYMAPEQGGDAHQVDIRADIYSLGATLYKLLTGDSPFAEHAHKPIMQRLMAIAQNDPPPIRTKRPDVPEKLAAIIHRMLAKRPEQRYATPAEVEEVLKPFCAGADLASLLVPEGATRVLEAPTRSSLPTPAIAAKSEAGRRTKVLIAGVAAVLLLAAVMVISTKHGKVEVTSPDGELPADVKISVLKNGYEIEVLQSDNHWSAKLVNGEYQVSLRGGDDKFELKDSKLTISRMGRARVELALKREAVASYGKVEVTSPDGELPANVKISVLKNGDEIEVLQSDNHWSAKLVNGEYQVSLRGGDDKFELKDSKLTISRMGRARVELALKREAVASTTTPKTEPTAPSKVTTPPDTTKSSPPVVTKAVVEKPFTLERAGQKLKSYKSLGAAYDDLQPGDILLVQGSGRIDVNFPELKKPLKLKGIGEDRPLLCLTNGADGVPHSHAIPIEAELILEGCDVDARTTTFFVRTQGNLESHGCRIWGGGTAIGRAMFKDCILVGHLIASGYVEPATSEVVLENCAIRPMGENFFAFQGRHTELRMTRCSFSCRSGGFMVVPKDATVTVTATDNLFDSPTGVFVFDEVGKPWHSMEAYKRVNWTGSGNCFGERWFGNYELDENQQVVEKTKGLEAWNGLWKEPEQNSIEAGQVALAFGRVQQAAAPERLERMASEVEVLRNLHPLNNIGPDVRLIGAGDAYVRALAAAGQPVSDDDLRPERPEDGPVLLMRNAKLVKSYQLLETAIQNANDGDVIELRTDGTLPGGNTPGSGRLLTIKSAPGYRPLVSSLVVGKDRLILEGLVIEGGLFASGGHAIEDPSKPFPADGGIVRMSNCSVVSEVSGGSVNGWLYPTEGGAPVIQNCDFSNVGFAVPAKSNATISNSVFCWMWLTTTGTPETTGQLTFDRCLVWKPQSAPGRWGAYMVTRGTSRVRWNQSLFVVDSPLIGDGTILNQGFNAITSEMFTGENNAFIMPSAWHGHRLQRFRKLFGMSLNGIELPPLDFDPKQFTIQRDLSPNYKPRPDGSDYGVDLDRLAKAIVVGQQ